MTSAAGKVAWLWTWSGESFGYREGNDLWTYDGRHVGHFHSDEIYGPDGRYLGELVNGDRLIAVQFKYGQREGAFTPQAPARN